MTKVTGAGHRLESRCGTLEACATERLYSGNAANQKSGAIFRLPHVAPGRATTLLFGQTRPPSQRHLGRAAGLNNFILENECPKLNTVKIVFSGTSGRAVRWSGGCRVEQAYRVAGRIRHRNRAIDCLRGGGLPHSIQRLPTASG